MRIYLNLLTGSGPSRDQLIDLDLGSTDEVKVFKDEGEYDMACGGGGGNGSGGGVAGDGTGSVFECIIHTSLRF